MAWGAPASSSGPNSMPPRALYSTLARGMSKPQGSWRTIFRRRAPGVRRGSAVLASAPMSGSFGMRFQPGSRHSSRMKPRPPRHTHRLFRGRLAERRNTWAEGEVHGMRRWFQALAIGVGLATAFASGANAQNPSSLDRILKEKKLRVTAEVTAPPFGMIDANGQPDGSEVATARQLAKDLGVDVDFIQVTGPQRIPTLLSGRADIAISSLSMTIDRAKVVMFASPHGALSIVIAAPASVEIKDAKGMSGKRIGITRATLEEATVPKIAPPDARIVLFDDIAATIQALLSGQVDAAGFSAFTSKSVADRNPDKKLEDKFTVTTAFYAAALRPGDHDLLHFVNTWIALRTRDGTLGQIYEKYTGVKLVPLPPL